MSVYVGAKKAKVYKGYYEPAQIFKGTTKIAGFKTVDKSGTSLTGNDTYNDFLPLTISGKSEQATSVQSVNVWDTTIKTQTVSGVTITIADDKKITLNGTANSAIEIKLSENQWVDTTNKNYICSTGINLQTGMSLFFQDRGGNLRNSILSGQKQTQLQNGYVYIASVLKITGGAIFSNFVFYQQCDEGTTPSNYTTFVPNSPSPDYPAPIRSSEDFDVVSCGRNLLNCSIRRDFIGTTSTWNPDTNSLLVNGGWFTSVMITLEPDTDYYFSAIREGDTVGGSGSVTIFVATGTAQSDVIISLGGRDGTFHTRPAVTEYQILLYVSYGTQGECTFRNTGVSKGIVETPYQPYHATTAHVTDPLRSVGDVSDSIEVSEGKVEVVRRVVRVAITSSSNIVEHTYRYHNGYTHFRHYPRLGQMSQKTICNLLPYVQYSWSIPTECISCSSDTIYPTFANAPLGISDTDTPAQKVSKLKSWLETHEMYVDVLPDTPTRTDITVTPLGQEFLALRTQPKYTNVYTNATIPPMLRSKIKELEL